MPTREPRSPTAGVRAHPWLAACVAGSLVVLLVVTLLGGWARSTPGGPVRFAPGSEVKAAPFRVWLHEAAAEYVVSGTDAEPGQAYVVVEGEIELDAKDSVAVTTLNAALTADLVDAYDQFGSPTDEPEASIRVVADGSRLAGLGPGLRYDVQLVFVVAERSVPDRLTVTLLGHTWRASALDGDYGWFDAAPVARVTLDVARLPDARPEPEDF